MKLKEIKCRECKTIKPIEDFYKNKGAKTGHALDCKKCYNDVKKRLRGKSIVIQPAYIYILKHPSFEGWLKIGKTTNLKSRIAQYNTGCPLRQYEYVYTIYVNNYSEVESYFNKQKIKHGIGYEWYKVELNEAIEIIKQVADEYKR